MQDLTHVLSKVDKLLAELPPPGDAFLGKHSSPEAVEGQCHVLNRVTAEVARLQYQVKKGQDLAFVQTLAPRIVAAADRLQVPGEGGCGVAWFLACRSCRRLGGLGRTLQHARTMRGIELECMRHGTRSRRPSVRSDNIRQNDWGPAFPRLLPQPPWQTYLDLALEAAIRQQVPTALGACLNSYASINRPQAAEQVPTRGSGKARSWAVGCLRVNKPLPLSPCAAAGWLPSMHAEHATLLQKLALGGCARNHAAGVVTAHSQDRFCAHPPKSQQLPPNGQ